ncbi:MAG: hypothetical protein U5K30_00595 [Acidimicrobiales bacterium]|nr:hypothetical protein [Acidimicrobiales bacterium]
MGLYVVAATLTEVIWFVPDARSQALLPAGRRAVRQAGSSSDTALDFSVTATAATLIAISAPVSVPVLFGAAYEDSVSVVPWLAAASVAMAVRRLVVIDLVYSDRSGHQSRVRTDRRRGDERDRSGARAARGGIVGAGIGSLAGYLSAAVVALHAWRSLPGTSLTALARPSFEALRVGSRRFFALSRSRDSRREEP